MQDYLKPINIVFVILVGLLVYFSFGADSHLRQAQKLTTQIQDTLRAARRDLVMARMEINGMLTRLNEAEIQLNLLRIQRDSIDLSVKRRLAKDQKIAKQYDELLKQLLEQKNKIQKEAKSFAL